MQNDRQKIRRLAGVCALALMITVLMSGCGFWKKAVSVGVIGGADGPTAVYVTDTEGNPVEMPKPKTAKELIVGKWKFDHVEDESGNPVELSEVRIGSAELSGMLAKALSSGTALEFTADGKLKASVLSVNYSFDSDSTIKVGGGILPQDFEKIPVAVSDSALEVRAGGYTVILKRS